MALLKYTTQIDVEKTIGEIQKLLSSHGANAILTEYGKDSDIVALSFKINVNGNDIGFKLPSDWHPVLQILENDKKVPVRLKNRVQAVRVAWRIILAWVEAQMAIIDTKMVSIDEVFLPYAMTPSGKTLYAHTQENNLLVSGTKKVAD